ncbi:MAG: hypothetical protein ACXABY_05910 [Candidatus Thorarchaeota archaeon]|jgi:predicted heme/steroid binding protein
MNPFKVTIEGRPRSTVKVGGTRQYEVDIAVLWNDQQHQTLQKNGIEMVLSDEATARKFMEDLLVAFRGATVVNHGRLPPHKEE